MFGKKDIKEDVKSTDEIQNGGQKTDQERIADLEARLEDVITRNCLLEAGR